MNHLLTQIVEGCKKQDRNAQIQFYKLYYKMVYNSCIRILSDPRDAEECMQESFMKAFDKITMIGEAPPEAWIRRITIHTALDMLKKMKWEWEEWNDKVAATEEEVPEEEEGVQWQVEQIKKTMESMPDQYRLILNLHLLEGYDYEEMAEILNIGAVTIRSQYSRARRKLIQLMKEKSKICV